MNGKMLLRDPEIFPTNEVLNKELGDRIYTTLNTLLQTITGEDYGLCIEWRFYRDGRSWLGKATYKKKTILWLSLWDGFFRVSFYFTERHRESIVGLDISQMLRTNFTKSQPVGKLIPFIIDITHNEQLMDILTIIRFKMSVR